MPFRRRGSYGRSRMGPVSVTNKNNPSLLTAGVAGTQQNITLARAVDSATNAVTVDVQRGCVIKAIWLEFWANGTASTPPIDSVSSIIDVYMMKNPGANLTPPVPSTQGSSNEKKFIFKTWKGILTNRSQGTPLYNWRGWIKIPKLYQRFGADDLLQLVVIFSGQDGLLCNTSIYKWRI